MLPGSHTCCEPANWVAFASPCHKSPISDGDNSHRVTSSIKFYAMEALNIALEIENVSEIDKFSTDFLLLP